MAFKDQSWIEVRVVVPPAAADAITGFLFDRGSLGTTEETGTDPTRGEYVLVRAYFETIERGTFEKDLLAAMEAAGAPKSRIWIDDLPYGDWAEGWKKYFTPRKVGARIVIAPTWETYDPKGDEIVVRVDPGMAFGTGQHETTALCIRSLEEVVTPGTRVLDVGAGSGILAIAAVLLGAASAHGTDIDPEATAAARENVEANGLAAKVTIDESPLEAVGVFPVVVANILAETLVSLAPALAAKVERGGALVLSGILHHLGDEVARAYAPHGFPRFDVRRDGEWVCLVGRRD